MIFTKNGRVSQGYRQTEELFPIPLRSVVGLYNKILTSVNTFFFSQTNLHAIGLGFSTFIYICGPNEAVTLFLLAVAFDSTINKTST